MVRMQIRVLIRIRKVRMRIRRSASVKKIMWIQNTAWKRSLILKRPGYSLIIWRLSTHLSSLFAFVIVQQLLIVGTLAARGPCSYSAGQHHINACSGFHVITHIHTFIYVVPTIHSTVYVYTGTVYVCLLNIRYRGIPTFYYYYSKLLIGRHYCLLLYWSGS
jgi:hypothetical protein